MAIPWPAALLRHEFTLTGDVQPASFGLWFSLPQTPQPGDMQTWVDGSALTNFTTNLMPALKNCLGSIDHISGLTAYGYDQSGNLVDQGVHSLNEAGSTATRGFPQVAMVATLRTNSYGRSFRGRIYIPFTVGSSDGRLPTTNVNAVGDGLGTYLSTFLVDGRIPIVNSRTRDLGTVIVSVTVDNVADTQRRRRDQVSATVTRTAPVSGD